LIVTTGLLIQHRDFFGLDNRYIGRRFLPSEYRPNDGPEVRSDIVVTDLHSGRILGTTGAVILDVVTVCWLILLLTGVSMYVKRANSVRKTGSSDALAASPLSPEDTEDRETP
jgi:hypothetical protein